MTPGPDAAAPRPRNASSLDAVKRLEGEFLALVEALRHRDPEEAERRLERLRAADPDDVEFFWYMTQGLWHEEKRVFLRYNNERVERRFAERTPRSILLLLPFCLQQTNCSHRIVWDTSHCRRCGLCSVGDLMEIAEKAGASTRVAIRGIFAPKFIRELDPELTIAVACEDELFLGVLRLPNRACYTILNERPEGYCVNTTVDLERVEGAFRLFTRREAA